MPAVLSHAIAMVSSHLVRHGFPLAQPVRARFRTNEHGSSGIEVTVKLRDPVRVAAARAMLLERFGGADVDVIDVA
jgi:hypothetical protein